MNVGLASHEDGYKEQRNCLTGSDNGITNDLINASNAITDTTFGNGVTKEHAALPEFGGRKGEPAGLGRNDKPVCVKGAQPQQFGQQQQYEQREMMTSSQFSKGSTIPKGSRNSVGAGGRSRGTAGFFEMQQQNSNVFHRNRNLFGNGKSVRQFSGGLAVTNPGESNKQPATQKNGFGASNDGGKDIAKVSSASKSKGSAQFAGHVDALSISAVKFFVRESVVALVALGIVLTSKSNNAADAQTLCQQDWSWENFCNRLKEVTNRKPWKYVFQKNLEVRWAFVRLVFPDFTRKADVMGLISSNEIWPDKSKSVPIDTFIRKDMEQIGMLETDGGFVFEKLTDRDRQQRFCVFFRKCRRFYFHARFARGHRRSIIQYYAACL